jgi:arylsulfatase A-like enzyme
MSLGESADASSDGKQWRLRRLDQYRIAHRTRRLRLPNFKGNLIGIPSTMLGMTICLVQPKLARSIMGLRHSFFIAIARLLYAAAAVTAANATPVADSPGRAGGHVVLIVWDGMRPDFVTEKYTPTLNKLAHDGVLFCNHHSVYPTATDVNGAALASGCYPNRNGLAANLEFRPAINPRQPVDMGDPDSIKRGDEVSGRKYLSVPTFVELLRASGKKVALLGVKSVAILFDRQNDWTVARIKGKPLTIFAGAPLGPSAREEMIKLLGPIRDDPLATTADRNQYASRALTEFFWRDGVPDFSLLWLSEPDLAEHNHAPGSPDAIAAIKAADDDLAIVLNALEKKKARDTTDVFVVSDHGFSTIRRSIDLVDLLNNAGFHAAKEFSEKPNPGDILVAGNGGTVLFYVYNHEHEVTQRLVDWLQHSDFAGVIFTRDKLEGSFPLSAAHLDNSQADCVMSLRPRSYDKNRFGVPGMIDADWNRKPGEGTHATLSPKDIHNLLVACGPSFRTGQEDHRPTSNLDLFPTISQILGTRSPDKVDGRALQEAMPEKTTNAPARTRMLEVSRDFPDGQWKQALQITSFLNADYLDEGNGEFTPK